MNHRIMQPLDLVELLLDLKASPRLQLEFPGDGIKLVLSVQRLWNFYVHVEKTDILYPDRVEGIINRTSFFRGAEAQPQSPGEASCVLVTCHVQAGWTSMLKQ